MVPPDSRREVGGIVWAKAEAVSKDCKRTFGAGISEKWIFGTVLEVYKTKKNDKSKKHTTYLKASYKVGDTTQEKSLPLQTLKAQDPNVALRQLLRPTMMLRRTTTTITRMRTQTLTMVEQPQPQQQPQPQPQPQQQQQQQPLEPRVLVVALEPQLPWLSPPELDQSRSQRHMSMSGLTETTSTVRSMVLPLVSTGNF